MQRSPSCKLSESAPIVRWSEKRDYQEEKKQNEVQVVSHDHPGPGTYPYMAPEMFKTGCYGPSIDIYSLGCLLIELFGKRRVWPGLDGPDIMVQIMGTYDTPPLTNAGYMHYY